MNVNEYISEYCTDGENIVTFDGLDEAFVGIGYIFHKAFACYDKQKIIKILVDGDCMTFDEAEEFFEFNIAGLYAGARRRRGDGG